MIRGALLVCSLALLTSAGMPILGSAQEPESEQSDVRSQADESEQPDESEQRAESEQPEGREQWRERLFAANQRVANAEKRSAAAHSAYKTMRHRRRPRGDAKQAIMDEIALSREEIARAQQNLEKLERAARRAGAPPSWLRFDPAKIEAATQVPASQGS
jgi:hypothetical protein